MSLFIIRNSLINLYVKLSSDNLGFKKKLSANTAIIEDVTIINIYGDPILKYLYKKKRNPRIDQKGAVQGFSK